jgi:hypothetical protein
MIENEAKKERMRRTYSVHRPSFAIPSSPLWICIAIHVVCSQWLIEMNNDSHGRPAGLHRRLSAAATSKEEEEEEED